VASLEANFRLLDLTRLNVLRLTSSFDYELAAPSYFISPTHKRTEGRAPCGALSLLQKDAALQGGYSKNRCRLNVKLRDLRAWW
jgi:hypothetical protein